jgi:hypothetical protein
MNTYDPADYIVYVHMARQATPRVTPAWSTGTSDRLPSGYANESPRTRLRGCIFVGPPAGKPRRVARADECCDGSHEDTQARIAARVA